MKAKYVLFGVVILAALVLAPPTITISPRLVAPGGVVTISITGTGEEKCGIEIVDPIGAKVFVKEITLSAGSGSVTWSVPSTARPGTYTVYVACEISRDASGTLTVTALVGGDARRDFAPLLLTALAGAIIAAAALMVKKRIF